MVNEWESQSWNTGFWILSLSKAILKSNIVLPQRCVAIEMAELKYILEELLSGRLSS